MAKAPFARAQGGRAKAPALRAFVPSLAALVPPAHGAAGGHTFAPAALTPATQ